MDSINSSLTGFGSLLNSPLQSGSVHKKPGAAVSDETSKDGSAGNVLQDFGQLLKDQMHHINDLNSVAEEAKQTYALGGDIELHNVILAGEKADLSLQLAMQIRNKMINAYQEITRMNI